MPRVDHFDITTDDPASAIEFYSGVFGWKFERFRESKMADYWVINTGNDNESGIDGGMVRRRDAGFKVATSISVASIDEYLTKIKQYGGKTGPKASIKGVGHFADCADRDGNPFSIVQWDAGAA